MSPGPASDGERISETVGDDCKRLDRWIARQGLIPSRAQARRLIRQGRVRVNGHTATKGGHALRTGDIVEIFIPDEPTMQAHPEAISLDIRYEDRNLLVVNKPRGMVVHPGPGHDSGTLVHALLHYYPPIRDVGPPLRPGIVHRLDKGTTGLLAVAKNNHALASLSRQLQDRTMLREYIAFVEGSVSITRGVVDAPIARHPVERKRMAVVEGGRHARTRFWVMQSAPGSTMLGLALETGRMHQIRVHMAHMGHPVMGDVVYGAVAHPALGEGYALHAAHIGLTHPATGEALTVTADLPGDMRGLIPPNDA